jgi:DUF2075 family protein
MIVYKNTKTRFLEDVFSNDIEGIVATAVRKMLGIGPAPNEIRSWKNSLSYMYRVLSDTGIPEDSSVAIEYRIPQTSKRIDFILAGKDGEWKENIVLVELKQWERAELTGKDAVVRTFLNKSMREVSHPSYQAWSYCALIQDYNESVYTSDISLHPCAYLHNYSSDGIIDHQFYQEHMEKAPLFLKADALKLQAFIKEYIKYGDDKDVMYRIDHGRIRPSKSLADSLDSMMLGNEEFVLIDDQKVVYEKAIALAKASGMKQKKVLIVHGGPGTGKTVVAINLLVKLTGLGLVSQYVTKNSAPRAVYEAKLTGTLKKGRISNLFKGSGGYIETAPDVFDALIVDESHRLNEKSGLYGNLGQNQIKELISASKFTVFFIDEDQRVTLQDIGTREEILKWARFHECEVEEDELSSQFRCNGSDGYLAWIDDLLDIRETANKELNGKEYDFRVFDDPNRLFDAVVERNGVNNKSRVVAGYCWDWKSKSDPKVFDIVLSDFGFRKKWNLASYGSLWMVDPNSISEVGCIHTCQGLELDYVGVIIGPDMVYRDGRIVTDVSRRSSRDKSIRGYKKLMETDRKAAELKLDGIIKNTYRTLMTRGLKGCFVYCTDKALGNHLIQRLKLKNYPDSDSLMGLAAEE